MRLIDADAFIEFLKETSKKLEFDKIEFKDSSLTAQAIIDGVIADLDGTSLDGFENAPTIEPEQRWIPVSERLPEEDDDVLLLMAEGEMAVGQRRGVNYWDGYRRRAVIVAWMSLPEPWRGE